MQIEVVIDPSRVWGWHAKLVSALRADGRAVSVRPLEEAQRRPRPAGYALLEALESVIARGAPLRYANRLRFADLETGAAAQRCDLVIDASGVGMESSQEQRIARILFDGGGEHAAMAALCAGDNPVIALVDGEGRILREARPAIERPDALSRALEHLFSRAFTLARLAPTAETPIAGLSVLRANQASAPGLAAFAGRAASAVAARLERLVRTAPRWRAGYRSVRNDRVIDRGRWPTEAYAPIKDDGARFYADPFVVRRGDACHIFLEEFPFATGKGVLSYVALDAEGRASAPRPALERPYHLSYPMIFERDGAIWMIPETSSAGTVELYRADPFPDRWILERTLIENVIASDMTLTEHGGKLWLLGTLAEEGGSTWDGLCAFHADHLLGEWRAHSANPLIIDASCARPAGMTAQTESGLIRPVQDCRGRYGAALALARIDRLDETGFAQSLIARLPPDARWNAVGAHTLNEAGGVEAADWIA